jgi:hypothetical protein
VNIQVRFVSIVVTTLSNSHSIRIVSFRHSTHAAALLWPLALITPADAVADNTISETPTTISLLIFIITPFCFDASQ